MQKASCPCGAVTNAATATRSPRPRIIQTCETHSVVRLCGHPTATPSESSAHTTTPRNVACRATHAAHICTYAHTRRPLHTGNIHELQFCTGLHTRPHTRKHAPEPCATTARRLLGALGSAGLPKCRLRRTRHHATHATLAVDSNSLAPAEVTRKLVCHARDTGNSTDQR